LPLSKKLFPIAFKTAGFRRELKRGEASLLKNLPPLLLGEGDKGGEVNKI